MGTTIESYSADPAAFIAAIAKFTSPDDQHDQLDKLFLQSPGAQWHNHAVILHLLGYPMPINLTN